MANRIEDDGDDSIPSTTTQWILFARKIFALIVLYHDSDKTGTCLFDVSTHCSNLY